MINSKLKFYFYKKKGNQNNIKHTERILLSELQVELDWKSLESRGRGKATLFWAVPAAALREAEPSWLTPPRVSREEGGSGGLLCSGVGALLGTSYQSLVVEKLEISKEYSGFFFFVCDDQVFYHSFRKGF